jgi:D-inositol-3-phosphate glycosyltransferase
MRVSLLTGGHDPHYAIPLAAALADAAIHVEFVANDTMETEQGLKHPEISYVNLRGSQDPRAPLRVKVARVLRYYWKLVSYTQRTESKIFHVLWLNKFEWFDRTVLNIFYRLSGKKLVFTAHNVNAHKRDGADTWLNRMMLRAMYALFDHVFVHTEPSKAELVGDFGVDPTKVTVIPYGLNTHVPDTTLSRNEARAHLGLGEDEKILLFFGLIAPYKGLDILVDAMSLLDSQKPNCRLVIAGRAKVGSQQFWTTLKSQLAHEPLCSRVTVVDGYIPDRDIPVLFRAADALVLPYRAIYQSGPLSLAYRFGVPVIATRVGAFDRDIIPDVTGVLCEPESPLDLARAIEWYLRSNMYLNRDVTEKRIREIGLERYSWDQITRTISGVYARL